MIPKTLSLCLTWAAGWLLSPLPTFGVILNDCDENSLRTSIATGGLVQFACDGTIPIHGRLEITQAVELDATGKNVKLDALGASRIFHIQPGGSLTLRGLELTGGSETNGGAIFIEGGELKLYQCRISNNQALGQNGGFTSGTTTYLNGQPGSGGALFNLGGRVIAIDSQFQDNTAKGGTGDIIPTSDGAEGGNGQGGALASLGGSVALTNCRFSANLASGGAGGPSPAFSQRPGAGGQGFGGALYIENAQLTMQGCEVSNNTSQGGATGGGNSRFGVAGSAAAGGGIASQGTSSAQIQSTRVLENRALGGASSGSFQAPNGPGQGGGIYVGGGTLEASDSEVSRNWVGEMSFGNIGHGGGVYNSATNSLIRCHIEANSAPTSGGGLYNSRNLRTSESLLLNNRAGAHESSPGLGGGAYLASGSAQFLNSTFTRNSTFSNSAEAGAALHNRGEASVGFCTIAENGGPGSAMIYSTTTLQLIGSILANHNAAINLAGAVQDLGHNISSDASLALAGPGSRHSTDPLLLPLADNGGPTLTMAIHAASPAFNNGGTLDIPATDQRGRPRPEFQVADSGAYELGPDSVTPLKILSIAIGPGLQLQLGGSGPALQEFTLEESADLRSWTTRGSDRVSAAGTWAIQTPRTAERNFFRLRAK